MIFHSNTMMIKVFYEADSESPVLLLVKGKAFREMRYSLASEIFFSGTCATLLVIRPLP